MQVLSVSVVHVAAVFASQAWFPRPLRILERMAGVVVWPAAGLVASGAGIVGRSGGVLDGFSEDMASLG
jgi:hypothetical protein